MIKRELTIPFKIGKIASGIEIVGIDVREGGYHNIFFM